MPAARLGEGVRNLVFQEGVFRNFLGAGSPDFKRSPLCLAKATAPLWLPSSSRG